MLYIVRGKNHNNDRTLRVHADSAEQAEKIGWKRGLFVTEVIAVEKTTCSSRLLDRLPGLAWKSWRHTPMNAFKAFGRSVSTGQAATLVLLGCITWVVDLHALRFI